MTSVPKVPLPKQRRGKAELEGDVEFCFCLTNGRELSLRNVIKVHNCLFFFFSPPGERYWG